MLNHMGQKLTVQLFIVILESMILDYFGILSSLQKCFSCILVKNVLIFEQLENFELTKFKLGTGQNLLGTRAETIDRGEDFSSRKKGAKTFLREKRGRRHFSREKGAKTFSRKKWGGVKIFLMQHFENQNFNLQKMRPKSKLCWVKWLSCVHWSIMHKTR